MNICIENFIPLGYRDRVSRVELRITTGLTDRQVRRAIEEARERGVLIASEDGGYFQYQDEQDDVYFRAYMKREERRFRTISHQNKSLRKAWEAIHPKKDNTQIPGQMSFL